MSFIIRDSIENKFFNRKKKWVYIEDVTINDFDHWLKVSQTLGKMGAKREWTVIGSEHLLLTYIEDGKPDLIQILKGSVSEHRDKIKELNREIDLLTQTNQSLLREGIDRNNLVESLTRKIKSLEEK